MDLIEVQVGEALHRVADSRPVDPQAAWRKLNDRLGSARPSVRRRRTFAVAAAAVAMAAVALLAGQIVVGKDALPASSAAGVLRQAGVVAAASDAAARPDQFVHLRIAGVVSVGAATPERTITYLQPQTRDVWLSVDGSRPGAYRVVYGTPTFLKPGDEQLLRVAGEAPNRAKSTEDGVIPPLGRSTTGSRAPGNDDGAAASAAATETQYRRLQRLPADPGDLFRLMSLPGGDQADRSERTLGNIADNLFYSTARPALRAALFEAAARIPGVSVVTDPTVADGSLRAVAANGTGVRRTVVFDVHTSEVVRERLVVTDETAFRGAPAGTAVQDITVKASIADSAGGT